MDVIILAGGLGTRLKSAVADRPKCMADINGKPFLWYLLKYLSRYDEVTQVILSVGYLREIIFDWIKQVSEEFPFRVVFSAETEPLGTGGAIKLAMKKATGSDVIVMNGDTFFDVDLRELYQKHRFFPASVTLALKGMNNFDRYGRVVIDAIDNHIVEFCEKQQCDAGLINGGIYVINRMERLFDKMPDKFSFENDFLKTILQSGKELYGVVQNGYFIDIGIPGDYNRAKIELSKRQL